LLFRGEYPTTVVLRGRSKSSTIIPALKPVVIDK